MLLQIIIDNQKEIEMSKEKITSLTLQVTEQDERSGQLETMESKWYNYKPNKMDFLKTIILHILYNPTLAKLLHALCCNKIFYLS